MNTRTLFSLFEPIQAPECEDCGANKTLIGNTFTCLNCNPNAADPIDREEEEDGLPPLREHQEVLFEKTRQRFRSGDRAVLMVLPTGGGKTVVACHAMKNTAEKGNNAAFLCDRINLVDQASEELSKGKIKHGVAQSVNTRDRNEPIQVVSIQTAEKRGFLTENTPELIVVDEAHISRKQVTNAIKTIKAAKSGRVLGLTATPLTAGLGDIYDSMVSGETTTELMKQGWLVPLTVFPMTEIDMKGASKDNSGEWLDSEVETRGTVIIGDIVKEWISKTKDVFGEPRPTLAFTATVEQGRILKEAFCKAGYNFEQVSYLDGRNREERKEVIDKFKNGEYIGLISVDALSRGFDAPNAEVLIAARPFLKSLAAWIQMLGRVMRISPATHKTKAIVIDHGGSWLRLYQDTMDFFDFGVATLPKGKKEKAEVNKPLDEEERGDPRKCPKCSAAMPPRVKTCSFCGFEFPDRTTITNVEGEVIRIDHVGSPDGKQLDGKWAWSQVCKEATNRYPQDEYKASKRARYLYPLITNRAASGLVFEPEFGPVHPEIEKKAKHLAKVFALRKSFGRKKHA